LTFIHEFGHFYDYYVNFGNESSLDLSEISSNALELLALTRLDGKIDDELYRYLEYAGYLDFFEILIYQGFYSAFEHLAYDPEIDIEDGEVLSALVSRAARQVGLNDRYINQLDQVLIPHIIESPFYVQAYCTAITVSMDIYFAELEQLGAGFAAYGELIEKKGESEDFEELLLEVGLESPFKKLRLRSIADDIYYEIMGSHFFSIKNNAPNVA
jgi:oligoendopeptidase F